MSQQTRTELQTSINTDIADNTTGDITAGDVRVNLIDMTDSIPFLSGSNSLNGDVIITGSLIVSSSNVEFIENTVSTLQVTAQNTLSNGRAIIEAKSNSASCDMRAHGTEYDETLFGQNTQDSSLIMGRLGKFYIGTFESHPIIIGTGNVERMRILNTGEVGIGTTTPAEKLTVDGNISGSGNINVLGDVTASAFAGDGSALTNLPPSTPFPYTGSATITGSFTVTGSTEINLQDNSSKVFGIGGSAGSLVNGIAFSYNAGNQYQVSFFDQSSIRKTDISPGSIELTTDFSDFLTIRNNGAVKAISREEGMRSTRLSFETGTITTDGVLTIPKDVTGTLALELKGYLVASLPVGTVGDKAYVTDATSPTYLGTLTGGGSVICPVFYNGSAWISA
jgi:hypothetical protein